MAELDLLTKPKESWVPLTGLLEGIQIKVQYASPAAGEEFQKVLEKKGLGDLAKVPLKTFLTEYCTFYVKDWEGAKRGGEPAPYSPEELATLMVGLTSALNQVYKAVGDEMNFFGVNGKLPN